MTQPKQKIVFQTNHERVLVGTCLADESPLEPGVWMIPGGCVELAPPPIPEGHQARYGSGAWLLEPIPPAAVEHQVQVLVSESPTKHANDVVQAYMDQTAQLSGYENLLAAISYADEEAVPSFQEDGKRFRAWRSLVWAYVFAEQAQATQESDGESSLLDLLLGLPELEGQHARIDLTDWPYLEAGQ